MKMFGTDCTGATAAVNVPSGYVVWTDYAVAANSAANCILGGYWIWTPELTTATDAI